MMYQIQQDQTRCVKCGFLQTEPEQTTERFPFPAFWVKGQLLNARKNANGFCVTLLEEEFDPNHPDRALIFDSPYTCQEFISWWYMPEGGR